jgi:hypothetical protein
LLYRPFTLVRKKAEKFPTMTLKRDNDTEVQCNESLEPEASVDQSDGFPTPKLSHAGSEAPNAVEFSLQQQGFSGSTVHESFELDTCQYVFKFILRVKWSSGHRSSGFATSLLPVRDLMRRAML